MPRPGVPLAERPGLTFPLVNDSVTGSSDGGRGLGFKYTVKDALGSDADAGDARIISHWRRAFERTERLMMDIIFRIK